DMRLQDASGGETVATISERGTEAKLADMLTLAGTDLRTKLGVMDVEKSETAKAAATLPANQEAARLYSEGLAKLRQFNPLAARDLFVKAAAAEPDHPLIHAALATAWDELGFDAKAAEEARLAASLSAQLPQSEQLWVEGLFREATNDWEKAIGVYRSLLGIFPDNIEYGLRLASAQTSGGRGKDALATIESLRALPAP